MAVGKMCRMWHSHFSASDWFPLRHMLRILALSSECFAPSCEDPGLGKTNGKRMCVGRKTEFLIPASRLFAMLLLGGGFSPLKGSNTQMLHKVLTFKRLLLQYFWKALSHTMPALTCCRKGKSVTAAPQQQSSWKSQANHRKCLFIHYPLNLPWLYSHHIPEKQKRTISLHHDCNTIKWLHHYSNQC